MAAGRIFLRTFVLLLTLSFLGISLFALFAVPREKAALLSGMESQARSFATSITDLDVEAFLTNDYGAIVEVGSRAVKANPDVVYLATAAKHGVCIVQRARTWAQRDAGDPLCVSRIRPGTGVVEAGPQDSGTVYHYVYPVTPAGIEWGEMHVVLSARRLTTQIAAMYRNIALAGLVCLAVSVAVAFVFARHLTTPLLALRETMMRIGGGDLAARSDVRTRDEIEDLALAMNRMADTLVESITERKQAEEAARRLNEDLERRVLERTAALRDSEEKYRVLVDHSSEAIFVLQDGAIRFFNPATAAIAGRAGPQLSGASFTAMVEADDREHVARVLEASLGERRPGRLSGFRLLAQADSIRWADLGAVPIDWEGRPALLVFLRDVTEQRSLQTQLLHAEKMKAVGTLAGGIAHDFNNILTVILGEVSLMQFEEPDQDTLAQGLRNIATQVESASKLTRQLLGFARSGRYEVTSLAINDLARETTEMFGRAKRELVIRHAFAPDLRRVKGDRGQIAQVLMNLCMNAWQAMPSGGEITVTTENVVPGEAFCASHGLTPGTFAAITVRDTGAGMDEATQQRMFEPFFTTKDRKGGTGLGLASAYGIVKNHGGTFSVRSAPGAGTAVTFYLPTSDRPDSKQPDRESQAPARGTGRVLLVDDQPAVASIGRAILQKLGYEVLTASDGFDAVDVLDKRPGEIDLVLLDMVMPGLSGGETFDRLRQRDPSVKVILSSGYSQDGEAERILSRGCRGFIQKPFTAEQLARKVSEVLSG
jgi:PAS domain S-box-containing protein